jgi:hypothetical protein
VWTIAFVPDCALVVTLIMLLQTKLVDSREYIPLRPSLHVEAQTTGSRKHKS